MAKRMRGGNVTTQRAGTKFPTRGESLDMLNSPLSVRAMPGDVVPEVNNPSYPFRDPTGFIPGEEMNQPKKIARIK